MDNNTPLGVAAIYDAATNTTQIHFSYASDSDAKYFVCEVWDNDRRRWVPYDGLYGIVARQDK